VKTIRDNPADLRVEAETGRDRLPDDDHAFALVAGLRLWASRGMSEAHINFNYPCFVIMRPWPNNWRGKDGSRKLLAAAIRREIAARADELRRRGVRAPITEAEKEAAERYQHASGTALHKWLQRNR
jgi:hypothetical protein